jgi:putative sterol carrier protein
VTLEELLEQRVQRLRAEPELVAGLTARYRFDITGEEAGTWTLEINDGAVSMARGETMRPDVTVGMSGADFDALRTGQLNGFRAIMTGRIRVRGNPRLAMRLKDVFARPRQQENGGQ